LTIRPQWHSFDDYLTSLISKYRTTIKKYRTCVATLEKRELDASSIKEYAEEIDRLYHTVYSKALAKGPFLGHGYFLTLREQLEHSQFQVIGYFHDQDLVAFNSRLIDQRVLYSSFFGYNERVLNTYALFKNMLLDDIQYAIEHGLEAVNFGRGTYEIKSAFGAEPQNYPLFIRPMKLLPRLLLLIIKAALKPRRWTPRRPFKTSPQSS
jgi:predicted N-acyltransferase